MPRDRENMASASRALRVGGRALEEITGEPEPEVEQRDFLREGFRRLMGVSKPVRKYGEE
jgi:hypothetical protein